MNVQNASILKIIQAQATDGHIQAIRQVVLAQPYDDYFLKKMLFYINCTVGQKKKKKTPLFILIQIIVLKCNWYQSSWISVDFSYML